MASKLSKVPLSSWTRRVSTVSILQNGNNNLINSTKAFNYYRTFTSTSGAEQSNQHNDNRNNHRHNKQRQNHRQNQQNQHQQHQRNRNYNNNHDQSTEVSSNRKFGFTLNPSHIRHTFNEELLEFREKLTLSNQRTAKGSASLIDIEAAMNIYSKLKETPGVLSKSDVAQLIQALHASARVSVRTMSRVISGKRKQAVLQQNDTLANCLEIVGNDILSGTVVVNEFGLMQFFTAYATLNRPIRGLELYERFSTFESNESLRELMKSSGKVRGSIFHLLITAGEPLEKIEELYQETRELNITDLNIEHNMIHAYIRYDRVSEALKLYSNVLKLYLKDRQADYYFGRIHEFFVGDCSDINVALNFYFESIDDKVPYKVECHPSAVHRLLELSWKEHKDLNEIIKIWSSYLSTVKNYKESNFNMLTYGLFLHFFEQYPIATSESYEELKKVLSIYNECRGKVSAIFLNSLLTVVGSKWQEKDVILGIIDSFDLYGIEKRFDSIRVILNSFRGIDIEVNEIEKIWNQRLAVIDENPIEKYDLWALAKACNRSPERVEYFINVWRKFLEENQLDEESKQDIAGYFGVPSNETLNISERLSQDQV